MNTATKITLAAFVGILSLGSQLQTVYAKQPQSHMAVARQHHQSSKTLALKVGSKGASVKQVQKTLQKEGFYKGTINGIFGNQMRSSVIAFQKSEHLRADGIIGPRTQAAMK